ncbi:uncharacterized protein SPPG_02521 [Spizellomyces punctatus DAOM BR117]|uniref:SH3 domain-containing protein n=1 Tax=Spizellomyces punctatus (strain DAOM BR117) TaxID=645134 RepID=A0A0L0HLM4_SPIPD|nr:uncharacterized protein SPPG_02521 [Spizellomyces punctatus DAOM BR117]KND02017.1 hypothetical protein SPPG_02521 [Spizellomyces punctatus DAOM BR117]|eukprot:XP_016610056.1 hypothetical protein SPPG_02521 [Spizellomyces punctatus DAOM BR117]
MLKTLTKKTKKGDTDLTDPRDRSNQEFRDHVLGNISVNLSALVQKGWISEHTVDTLVQTLQSNGLTVSTTASVAVGNGAVQQENPPPPPERPPAYELPSVAVAGAYVSGDVKKHIDGAVNNANITGSANGGSVAEATAALNSFNMARSVTTPALSSALNSAPNDSAPPLPRRLGERSTTSAPASRNITPSGPPIPAPKPQRKIMVATADFEPLEEDDLGFRTGDLIAVIEDVDENWYRGTLRGKTGIFPKSFVQVRR